MGSALVNTSKKTALVQQGGLLGEQQGSVPQGLSYLSHLFAPELRGLNTKFLIPLVHSCATPLPNVKNYCYYE